MSPFDVFFATWLHNIYLFLSKNKINLRGGEGRLISCGGAYLYSGSVGLEWEVPTKNTIISKLI